MKKLLFLLVLFPAISLAARPRFPFPKSPDEIWQNNLDIIDDTSFKISTLSSGTYNTFKVGPGPVLTSTANPAAGGGLSVPASYYYKIYPVNNQGRVGIPSAEMAVSLTGGNQSTQLSWSTTTGAAYYRVSRGTAQGAQDGYYTVTGTTYTDTGAIGTGGNAFSIYSANWLVVGGTIFMPSSSGGIYFYDYVTGNIAGFLGITSSGEWEFKTGATGSAAGNYIFEDSSGAQMFFMNSSQFSGTGSQNLGVPSAPFVNGYFSGTVDVTGLLKGKGTGTNDSAATGYIGQYVSTQTLRSQAKALVTNVSTTICSVVISSGDWDVSFALGYTGASTTTYLDAALSTTLNTLPSASTIAVPDSTGQFWIEVPFNASAQSDLVLTSPQIRISQSSQNTTYYLIARAVIGVGTVNAFGHISARRVR